ncbi:hypothetical protein BO443_30074 [Burkholderia orbicola]
MKAIVSIFAGLLRNAHAMHRGHPVRRAVPDPLAEPPDVEMRFRAQWRRLPRTLCGRAR